MSSLLNTLRRRHSTVRADEQLRPDLGVRQAVPGEPGNLGFLGCELLARLGAAFADLIPGSDQFPAGALGERLHPDRGEQVVGGAQLLARGQARGPQPGGIHRLPPVAGLVVTLDEGRYRHVAPPRLDSVGPCCDRRAKPRLTRSR
jgi:hypothetical protein